MVFPLLVFPSLKPGAVRTQGLSEQWLETSFLGAPEWDDPCFGAVWGVWRLTRLDCTRNPGSIRSLSSPPPEVLEAKGSISPSKLFTHLLWAPEPFGKTPMCCAKTVSLLLKPTQQTQTPRLNHCAVLLNGFTELKIPGNSSLKSGDPTVPDGSTFTVLPPVSYLLSFSNNTLTAWQLSRAV